MRVKGNREMSTRRNIFVMAVEDTRWAESLGIPKFAGRATKIECSECHRSCWARTEEMEKMWGGMAPACRHCIFPDMPLPVVFQVLEGILDKVGTNQADILVENIYF